MPQLYPLLWFNLFIFVVGLFIVMLSLFNGVVNISLDEQKYTVFSKVMGWKW